MDQACRQLAERTTRDHWPDAFTMAVNVSGRELSDPGFPGRAAQVIRRHGINPSQLRLEITQTALSGEPGHAQQTLAALPATGVRIALDDFGTGYSTLARLQWLNADVLKIDRRFVAQIGQSARDRQIVAAVTAMCHALGMTAAGEGIETSCQLKTLTAMHCQEGQGFLFARPLPPEAILTLAAARHGTTPAVEPRWRIAS